MWQVELVEETIEAHAERLAELLFEGEPGVTRVEVVIRLTDNGAPETTITTANHDSDPLPALEEREMYCFRIAESFASDLDPHGWWLSGEGVISDGIDAWNIRIGPVDEISK